MQRQKMIWIIIYDQDFFLDLGFLPVILYRNCRARIAPLYCVYNMKLIFVIKCSQVELRLFIRLN